MADDTQRKGLPLLARPSCYELRLEPDFEEKIFKGNVKINARLFKHLGSWYFTLNTLPSPRRWFSFMTLRSHAHQFYRGSPLFLSFPHTHTYIHAPPLHWTDNLVDMTKLTKQ
ncbi:hypothetical protein CONLIGDRAFT_632243 [Coniochaeta ligniaria NRRL 30616]|uniref:Uncharacterized protein n=1 Tax=Coniochaeta ligniaria NRRL 30616 TaxID=1408157 RepID=A0A1J7IRP6_9PEZI|nr:hypothetical protein CONLIGDRAFT_632243 [Coniochaeta ligniaria NRRL 30616]